MIDSALFYNLTTKSELKMTDNEKENHENENEGPDKIGLEETVDEIQKKLDSLIIENDKNLLTKIDFTEVP